MDRLTRSNCTGHAEPSQMHKRKVTEFMRHGGGTKARMERKYCEAVSDLCAFDQSRVQAGRFNVYVLAGVFGYIAAALSGVPVRIFTRSNTYQVLLFVCVVLVLGFMIDFSHWEWKPASARDVSEQIYDRLTGKQTPIQYLVTDLADSFSSLTNFVLGLYVSLVLGSIYYAQRGMLGTAFSRVLGFTMHLVSSVTPAPALQGTGAPGPSGIPRAAPPVPAHIQAAKRRMVRWVNAVFRLLWLECCGYDGQIDDSIHVMDGSLGPLLTPKEWRRIRNLPSRATHIIHWANTAVIDLCSEGYLTPNGSAELSKMLDELRGSNNFGLSSLPYPYVFTIIMMTKLNLVFLTLKTAYQFAILRSCGDGVGWGIKMLGTVAFLLFKLIVTCWMYQALLELYILLRNPNQGELAGHMPVPTFLHFTEAVTLNILNNHETGAVPRPVYSGDSDDDTSPDEETDCTGALGPRHPGTSSIKLNVSM